jgi:hypothetical protein
MVACAWYWLGNTGVGLALLLLASRTRVAAGLDVESLLGIEARFLWVGRTRILVSCPYRGRLQIFRDEVNAAQWAALRRRGLGTQPATGRSTSI